MPDCLQADHSIAAPPWQASLQLGFARNGDCTRLVRRVHRGPLRVQKALYPEGPGVCHVIVVHPPGGVVGGDQLAVDLDAADGCRVLATSPGAAKWYRANGGVSSQHVVLRAGAGASIEWLPQETIFFDDASVTLAHEVELAAGATYIGSEVLCFGRRASGERFERGSIRQRTRIRVGGRLVWWEQGLLDGGTLDSPLGMNGHSVCATLIAVGTPAPAALLAQIRALDSGLAVSQVKNVFVARHLNDDSEHARRLITRAWQLLRPHLLGLPACVPRIWNT